MWTEIMDRMEIEINSKLCTSGYARSQLLGWFCSLNVPLLQEERWGMIGRNDVGFLIFEHSDLRTQALNIGSRLKTPSLPIWVTKCNDQVGVLFNPNRELMRSHHAENRYVLGRIYFYLALFLWWFSSYSFNPPKMSLTVKNILLLLSIVTLILSIILIPVLMSILVRVFIETSML